MKSKHLSKAINRVLALLLSFAMVATSSFVTPVLADDAVPGKAVTEALEAQNDEATEAADTEAAEVSEDKTDEAGDEADKADSEAESEEVVLIEEPIAEAVGNTAGEEEAEAPEETANAILELNSDDYFYTADGSSSATPSKISKATFRPMGEPATEYKNLDGTWVTEKKGAHSDMVIPAVEGEDTYILNKTSVNNGKTPAKAIPIEIPDGGVFYCEWEEFFNSKEDVNTKGYYLALDIRPDGGATYPAVDESNKNQTVIKTYYDRDFDGNWEIKEDSGLSLKLKDGDATKSAKTKDCFTLISKIDDCNENTGKRTIRKKIYFEIDWDGEGGESDAYAPTWYVIDLSGITLCKRESRSVIKKMDSTPSKYGAGADWITTALKSSSSFSDNMLLGSGKDLAQVLDSNGDPVGEGTEANPYKIEAPVGSVLKYSEWNEFMGETDPFYSTGYYLGIDIRPDEDIEFPSDEEYGDGKKYADEVIATIIKGNNRINETTGKIVSSEDIKFKQKNKDTFTEEGSNGVDCFTAVINLGKDEIEVGNKVVKLMIDWDGEEEKMFEPTYYDISFSKVTCVGLNEPSKALFRPMDDLNNYEDLDSWVTDDKKPGVSQNAMVIEPEDETYKTYKITKGNGTEKNPYVIDISSGVSDSVLYYSEWTEFMGKTDDAHTKGYYLAYDIRPVATLSTDENTAIITIVKSNDAADMTLTPKNADTLSGDSGKCFTIFQKIGDKDGKKTKNKIEMTIDWDGPEIKASDGSVISGNKYVPAYYELDLSKIKLQEKPSGVVFSNLNSVPSPYSTMTNKPGDNISDYSLEFPEVITKDAKTVTTGLPASFKGTLAASYTVKFDKVWDEDKRSYVNQKLKYTEFFGSSSTTFDDDSVNFSNNPDLCHGNYLFFNVASQDGEITQDALKNAKLWVRENDLWREEAFTDAEVTGKAPYANGSFLNKNEGSSLKNSFDYTTRVGDDKKIKFIVDWDGDGNIYKPVLYTFDFSNVDLEEPSFAVLDDDFHTHNFAKEVTLDNLKGLFEYKIGESTQTINNEVNAGTKNDASKLYLDIEYRTGDEDFEKVPEGGLSVSEIYPITFDVKYTYQYGVRDKRDTEKYEVTGGKKSIETTVTVEPVKYYGLTGTVNADNKTLTIEYLPKSEGNTERTTYKVESNYVFPGEWEASKGKIDKVILKTGNIAAEEFQKMVAYFCEKNEGTSKVAGIKELEIANDVNFTKKTENGFGETTLSAGDYDGDASTTVGWYYLRSVSIGKSVTMPTGVAAFKAPSVSGDDLVAMATYFLTDKKADGLSGKAAVGSFANGDTIKKYTYGNILDVDGVIFNDTNSATNLPDAGDGYEWWTKVSGGVFTKTDKNGGTEAISLTNGSVAKYVKTDDIKAGLTIERNGTNVIISYKEPENATDVARETYGVMVGNIVSRYDFPNTIKNVEAEKIILKTGKISSKELLSLVKELYDGVYETGVAKLEIAQGVDLSSNGATYISASDPANWNYLTEIVIGKDVKLPSDGLTLPTISGLYYAYENSVYNTVNLLSTAKLSGTYKAMRLSDIVYGRVKNNGWYAYNGTDGGIVLPTISGYTWQVEKSEATDAAGTFDALTQSEGKYVLASTKRVRLVSSAEGTKKKVTINVKGTGFADNESDVYNYGDVWGAEVSVVDGSKNDVTGDAKVQLTWFYKNSSEGTYTKITDEAETKDPLKIGYYKQTYVVSNPNFVDSESQQAIGTLEFQVKARPITLTLSDERSAFASNKKLTFRDIGEIEGSFVGTDYVSDDSFIFEKLDAGDAWESDTSTNTGNALTVPTNSNSVKRRVKLKSGSEGTDNQVLIKTNNEAGTDVTNNYKITYNFKTAEGDNANSCILTVKNEEALNDIPDGVVVHWVYPDDNTIDTMSYSGYKLYPPVWDDSVTGWYKDNTFTKEWNLTSDVVNKENTGDNEMWLYARSVKKISELSGSSNKVEIDTNSKIETVENYDFEVEDIADQAYTGKAIKPAIVIRKNGCVLKLKTDYKVTYDNKAINVGRYAATVEMTNILNSDGSKFKFKVYYKIVAKDVENAVITAAGQLVTGNKGTASAKAVSVKIDKLSLKPYKVTSKGTTGDFKAEYSQNGIKIKDAEAKADLSPGVYDVKITGIGNFTGEAVLEDAVTVADKDHLLKNAKFTLDDKTVELQRTKEPVYVGFRMKLGSKTNEINAYYDGSVDGNGVGYFGGTNNDDFKVTFKSNAKVGKATITVEPNTIRGYSGSASTTFTIKASKTLKASAMKSNWSKAIKGTKTITYTGEEYALYEVIKKVSQDTKYDVPHRGIDEYDWTHEIIPGLNYGEDYFVVYKNNVNAGKATMTFKATPGSVCTGSFSITFNIQKAALDIGPNDIIRNYAIDERTKEVDEWNGNIDFTLLGKPGKQTVVFTSGSRLFENNKTGNSLVEGVDYTVKYKNNKTTDELCTVTITGKGSYAGSKMIVTFDPREAYKRETGIY